MLPWAVAGRVRQREGAMESAAGICSHAAGPPARNSGEPLFTAQQRLESARVKCYRNQTPGFRPGFAGLLPDAYASVCLLFYQNTGHVPLAKRCWGIRKRGDSSLGNPQLLPL